MPWDDDNDWVGEPPEGRYTRDHAKPEFWRHPWHGQAPVALLLVIVNVAHDRCVHWVRAIAMSRRSTPPIGLRPADDRDRGRRQGVLRETILRAVKYPH